ncbi:MAG: hypothetical protein Q4B18_07790 [Bacillota bacterium]|nr:hypothetical protein [Bacillota bacterium]
MSEAEKNPFRFTIRIARKNVGIESIYGRTMMYSEDYLTDDPADFVVSSSQQEIMADGAEYRKVNPRGRVFKGEIESIVLLRKIADQMIGFDTILMHGAAIADGNGAYLFTAPSGTGKTTHIRRWMEELPGAYVVNGDKPLVIAGETPMVCGTPWCGKERMNTNTIVPLKAIVFMKRADENAMRRISFLEAFPRLLEQTHRPKDAEKMRKTVQLLSALAKNVQLWQFECNNFRSDAFETTYRALTGCDQQEGTIL